MQNSPLLDELFSLGNIEPSSEQSRLVGAALSWLAGQVLTLDEALTRIEKQLQDQTVELLHHPQFQRFEAAWRAIFFLVERIDFRQSIKLEILNCSKDDLQADFEDCQQIYHSGLWKLLHVGEYGSCGGKGYGAVLALYEMGPGPQDVQLLSQCSAIAEAVCVPFLASAGPQCFGMKEYAEMSNPGAFANRQTDRFWSAVRNTPRARCVALLAPSLLARQQYVGPGFFGGAEPVERPCDRVWMSPVVALAVCVARSFAEYRSGAHILGPADGFVDDLPCWTSPSGAIATAAEVDATVTANMAESGIVAVQPRGRGVLFERAPSWAASTGDWLEGLDPIMRQVNTGLSAFLWIGRIGQALKHHHKEQVGETLPRGQIEAELSWWLHRFMVAKLDVAPGSSEEVDQLKRIQKSSDPETALLVYGDWLEQRGLALHAEFVRCVRQRKRGSLWRANLDPDHSEATRRMSELSTQLDAKWRAAVIQIDSALHCPLDAVSIKVEEWETDARRAFQFLLEVNPCGGAGPIRARGILGREW